jgi:hypothetical protein
VAHLRATDAHLSEGINNQNCGRVLRDVMHFTTTIKMPVSRNIVCFIDGSVPLAVALGAALRKMDLSSATVTLVEYGPDGYINAGSIAFGSDASRK